MTPSVPKTFNSAMEAHSTLIMEDPLIDDTDGVSLQRLGQICLPRWDDRIKTQTVRPERLECAHALQDPWEASSMWIHVLQQLRNGLCSSEEITLGHSLDEDKSACWATRPFFRAISVILYDRECSGYPKPHPNSGMPRTEAERRIVELLKSLNPFLPTLSDALKGLLEHMLLVDYGIGTFPVHVSSKEEREQWQRVWPHVNRLGHDLAELATCCILGRPRYLGDLWKISERIRIASSGQIWGISRGKEKAVDQAELALMLYHYHAHRRPLERADYESGMTGYAGILQEMKDEAPLRGIYRLQRKLSVDVNDLIPLVVRDPEQRNKMIAIATSIAGGFRIHLKARQIPFAEKPSFELLYRDGSRIRKGWGWDRFREIFSFSTPKSKNMPGAEVKPVGCDKEAEELLIEL